MDTSTVKQVIELPKDVVDNLLELLPKQNLILDKIKSLEKPGSLPPQIWIPKKDFMVRLGIQRTKFQELKLTGLKTTLINRKTYVHVDEIERYFNGELK